MIFEADLSDLQPSQLYICSEKLAEVLRSMETGAAGPIEPVPVKRLGSATVLTDGHTRAFAAFRSGRSSVPACWEIDDLDWEAYEICVQWCLQEGIRTVGDLRDRVIPAEQYERLWHQRCRAMHERLARQRNQGRYSPPHS